MIDIQRLSTLTLVAVWGGKNIDRALKDTLRLATLPQALTDHQRAAIQDGAYGVLRYRTELEQVVNPLYQKGQPDLPLQLLLLLAAYQLLHTRLAAHAVVTHAVETAQLLGGEKVKGFVNGLLRSLLRQKDALLEQAHTSPEGRYAHPTWWIERLRQDNPQYWEEILQQAQQQAPMTLRVNRRFNSVEQYQQLLEAQEMPAERLGHEGLRLATPVPVQRLPGFERGLVSVQDASAQVAATLLGLHAGQRVLDACAAPGGKAAHILERVPHLALWALDREPDRVKKMRTDMKRLKLDFIMTCANAADSARWWDNKPFDRILLDAPCSGSGVVRRHPDIKWLRQSTDIPRMAQHQKHLLTQLWPLLKKGGRLVYATCSLFQEENQAVVAAFLDTCADAKALSVADIYEKSWAKSEKPSRGPNWHDGQISPDEDHDGFFYAALQKV